MIDPFTQRVRATLPTGHEPEGIAIPPAERSPAWLRAWQGAALP
ncbi:hypothetical protein [Streptomyces sp. NBRC 110611]|nr:hypothetical protein [Streptomyces sp. NBRC 110611]